MKRVYRTFELQRKADLVFRPWPEFFAHFGILENMFQYEMRAGVLTFDAKKSFYSRSAAISNYSWIASGSKLQKMLTSPFHYLLPSSKNPFRPDFQKGIEEVKTISELTV